MAKPLLLRLVVAFGLLAFASTWSYPASGDAGPMCTLGPEDPRVGLQKAGAAFIGMLSAYRTDGSAEAIATLSVDRVIKGDLPPIFEARVDRACPLDADLEQRRGFLVTRQGSEWAIEPDGAMAPEVLERAARPLPEPAGGRPALVAKIATSEVALAALDADGRVVAYGRGAAAPERLASCPAGSRVVSVSRREIAVWALPDLALSGRRPLRLGPDEAVLAVSCLSADGSDVLIAAGGGATPQVRLLRVQSGRTVATSTVPGGLTASLDGDTAWVSAQDGPTAALIAADGSAMSIRQVGAAAGRVAGDGLLHGSPDGARVAAMVAHGGRTHLTVTDVASGHVQQAVVDSSSVAWLDDSTILTAAGAFDATDLAPVEGPKLEGTDPTLMGGSVYALRSASGGRHRFGGAVSIVRVRADDRAPRTVATSVLDSPFVDDIAAIDRSALMPVAALETAAGAMMGQMMPASATVTDTAAPHLPVEDGPSLLLVLSAALQLAFMAWATASVAAVHRGV